MKLQLAKVGEHRNGLELTKKDLEDTLQNFKDTRPVAIGHITTGTEPKYGVVKKLKLNGDVLEGVVKLHKEADKMFRDGHFDKWSSGFKKNDKIGTYFHHLALLGAEPPGIEGLKVLDFSDETKKCDFFIDVNFSDKKNIPQKKENRDMGELEKLQKKQAELEAEIKVKEEKLEAEIKKSKEFSDSLASKRAESKKAKRDNLEKSLDGKIAKDKINLILDFSDGFEADKPLNFSDKKERDFYAVIDEVFDGVTPKVKTGEFNFSDSADGDSVDVNDVIKMM